MLPMVPDSRQKTQLPYAIYAVLLLLAATFLKPVAGVDAAAATIEEEPGAQFFHQGEDALSWDSDELAHVRQLHSKDISDVQTFLSARNLAAYFGLSHVESLHMPVPLTVVFIGFGGDGNMGVNISGSALSHWFGRLDHVLPHTRIQLAELDCAEDGHCAGVVHGTRAAASPWIAATRTGRAHSSSGSAAGRAHILAEPLPSTVHLNFSCNVVTVGTKVTRMWERALHAFSRPVDPEVAMGAQQVDAVKMEHFVDGFLAYLGLTRTYTLLVLNPTWTMAEPVYGYRQGMSQQELDAVLYHTEKLAELVHHPSLEQEPELAVPAATSRHGWAYAQRNKGAKFAVKDTQWDSHLWLANVDGYLQKEEAYRKELIKVVDKVPAAAALVQAARTISRDPGSAMAQVLRIDLLGGSHITQSVYSKFRTMHPAEDCLVPNWVGQGRWVLVDLTASGADWGPASGGEGVVTRASLPSVMDHFSKLATMKKSHIESTLTDADKELQRQLATKHSTHAGASANTAYRAFAQEMATAHAAAHAPGAPPQPDKDPEQVAAERVSAWKRKYTETLLRAELDVYDEFATKHCKDGASATQRSCMLMKQSAEKARNSLAKLAGSQGILGDVWRDHHWDIFGEQPSLEDESGEVMLEAERSHDLFMGQLAGVLSRALRHVVAPPTAAWAAPVHRPSKKASKALADADKEATSIQYRAAPPLADHVCILAAVCGDGAGAQR